MKFTIALTALATLAAASPGFSPNFKRTYKFSCENNCGRAINSGSQGAAVVAQHIADCNSYLAVTSTRPASTVTITRTQPTYASSCPTQTDYVSACACVSATPNTVWVDGCAATVINYV